MPTQISSSVTAPFPLPAAWPSCRAPMSYRADRKTVASVAFVSHSQACCCGTLLPNGDSAHCQMSDAQSRHEPLSELHCTYVSLYRVAGQGRAEAGNSKKRASNIHKLWASSVT